MCGQQSCVNGEVRVSGVVLRGSDEVTCRVSPIVSIDYPIPSHPIPSHTYLEHPFAISGDHGVRLEGVGRQGGGGGGHALGDD